MSDGQEVASKVNGFVEELEVKTKRRRWGVGVQMVMGSPRSCSQTLLNFSSHLLSAGITVVYFYAQYGGHSCEQS